MNSQSVNQFRVLLRASIVFGSILIISGCTTESPDLQASPPTDPVTNMTSPVERPWGREKYCDAPFDTSSVKSSVELMRASSDTTTKSVTLKSATKYGYNESAYNISQSCFARKGDGCEVQDQIFFNHGGDPKALQAYKGQLIYLRDEDSAKFDSISFENLDSLDLKSHTGASVSKATLFQKPVGSIWTSYWSLNPIKPGITAILLLNDPYYSRKYQLFKLKVVDLEAGDHITFVHQRMAEAADDEVRNFICSRRAILKTIGQKPEGEITIFTGERTGFDFETGLDSEDNEYILSKSYSQIIFGGPVPTTNGPKGIEAGVANGEESFGRIIGVGDKALSEISRQSWTEQKQIGAWPSTLTLKENSTYLISHINGKRSLFAAIRIAKIDDNGIRLQWKRVAEEPSLRISNFVADRASQEPRFEYATMDSDPSHAPNTEIARVGFPGFIRTVKFDPKTDSLIVESRIFPAHSGIIDATSNYVSLEVIPTSVDSSFTGAYKESEPIRVGACYVIATENFKERSVIVLEVVGFVPGRSVSVRYKILGKFTAQPVVESGRR